VLIKCLVSIIYQETNLRNALRSITANKSWVKSSFETPLPMANQSMTATSAQSGVSYSIWSQVRNSLHFIPECQTNCWN